MRKPLLSPPLPAPLRAGLRAAAPFGGVLGPAAALLALEGLAWALAAPQRGWGASSPWGDWALLALPSFAVAVAAALVWRFHRPLSALTRACADDAEIPLRRRSDALGELARAIAAMREGLHAERDALRRLAHEDALTGLLNRAGFVAALEAALAGAEGTALSVLLLRLDRCRHLAEVLGAGWGARMLQSAGQRLLGQQVRAGDLVAHFGGGEFALLLPGADAADAWGVAERLSDVFQLPITLDEQSVDLGVAFGLATWPEQGDDAAALLGRAAIALDAAGSDGMVAYAPALDRSSTLTLTLLAELGRALAAEQLRLFLQPTVSLVGGRLVGVVAGVRWHHPRQGLVEPAALLPGLEQTGLARSLLLWTVAAVAQQWPTLRGLGLSWVQISLAPRDLIDVDLADRLQRTLRRHGMPPQALCLGWNEADLVAEPARASAQADALRRAGFGLIVDEYGGGGTSLALLRRLAPDALRVARRWGRASERDEDAALIVRAAVAVARTLGLRAGAAGADSAALRRALTRLGCEEVLGEHIGPPLPATGLAEFEAQWSVQEQGLSAVAMH
ncbi:MAG: GGDEF domain-containing protein [Burkholderiales bacterium]|nr:GGDEF domain-containing protein [Burkholderiales bacterium]